MRGFVKAVRAPRRVWPVVWVIVIGLLTLTPGNDLPRWPWAAAIHLDKIVHFVLFGVLAWLLAGVFIFRNGMDRKRAVVLSVLAAVVYGGLIELLQGWMEMGRSAEWADLLADALGAVVAVGLVAMRRRTPLPA